MQRSILVIYLIVCSLFSVSYKGYSQSLSGQLQQNIDLIRSDKATNNIQWKNYTEEELRAAHNNELSLMRNDSLLAVRMKAYSYEKEIYDATQEEVFKTELVNVYVSALSDPSSLVQQDACARLLQFDPIHFDDKTRSFLVSKLNPIPVYYEDLVLALAYMNERSAIQPMIDHIRFQFSEMDQMQKWQVHIALSRLGEQPALDYIVKKAKNLPVNNDMVYEIYPSLVFTKQKAAIDVLVEQVFNDEANCLPADPNSSKKITCAYRVLELIAPAIKDFPLEVDEFSGDLLVDDYQKALKTARKWLEKNRTSYEVI